MSPFPWTRHPDWSFTAFGYRVERAGPGLWQLSYADDRMLVGFFGTARDAKRWAEKHMAESQARALDAHRDGGRDGTP